MPRGKQGNADEKRRKIDRQGAVVAHEHSFLNKNAPIIVNLDGGCIFILIYINFSETWPMVFKNCHICIILIGKKNKPQR